LAHCIMKSMVPTDFYLSQNYPNPFSGTTTIKFCLPCRTRVKLEILAAQSSVLEILLDEDKEAGTFEIEFDGSNLPEGNYVCLFQAGDFVASKKMVVEKP
jgi:hypothetical protein